jgi:hypothetical protein
VFPDEQAITDAGWSSQEASDLLAVLGPRLVGIPANRIRTFLKTMHGRRFSDWQVDADAARAGRGHAQRPAHSGRSSHPTGHAQNTGSPAELVGQSSPAPHSRTASAGRAPAGELGEKHSGRA